MTARRPGAAIFGLDLVRASAVSLVLASHGGDMIARWFGRQAWPAIGYGAYYGIELFFVLSGFLIGRILIDLAARGGGVRAWGRFMVRRWLRTLPAYYVWLGVIAVVWAPLLRLSGHALGHTVLIFAAMLQNLAWPMVRGNFFDVTWSLAVEEWFYLGFSALLLLGARVLRPGMALGLGITIFLAGPVLLRARSAWPAAGADHVVLYWLDSIAIGVLAALAASRFPRAFRAAAWLLPAALLVLAASAHGGLMRVGLDAHWSRVLGPDLLAVLLALGLPAAARWTDARGWWADAVRWISRASYSLYLVHLSVLGFVAARQAAWHLSPAAAAAVAVLAIGGIAWVLNAAVERPFMALRR